MEMEVKIQTNEKNEYDMEEKQKDRVTQTKRGEKKSTGT